MHTVEQYIYIYRKQQCCLPLTLLLSVVEDFSNGVYDCNIMRISVAESNSDSELLINMLLLPNTEYTVQNTFNIALRETAVSTRTDKEHTHTHTRTHARTHARTHTLIIKLTIIQANCVFVGWLVGFSKGGYFISHFSVGFGPHPYHFISD